MTPAETLTALLESAPVASLAVHEDGEPAVSLVPFVPVRDPLRFYLLVSDLAAHTRALRAEPRCGLMLHAAPQPGDARDNLALPRFMARGTARFVTREEAAALGAEPRVRAKYPAMAPTLLALPDFHFVEIAVARASWVQGFGAAFVARGANFDELEHVARR